MPRLDYPDSTTAAPTPVVTASRMPPLTSLQEAMARAAFHIYGPTRRVNDALHILIGWVVPATLQVIGDDYLNSLVSLLYRICLSVSDAATAHVVTTLAGRLDPLRLSMEARVRLDDLKAWGATWPSCGSEADPLRYVAS